jgi:hypothetical protein
LAAAAAIATGTEPIQQLTKVTRDPMTIKKAANEDTGQRQPPFVLMLRIVDPETPATPRQAVAVATTTVLALESHRPFDTRAD